MQLTETERATIRAWLEDRIEFNTHPLDVNRVVEIGKLIKELEVQSDVSINLLAHHLDTLIPVKHCHVTSNQFVG